MSIRFFRRRNVGWRWLTGGLFGRGRRLGRRAVRTRRPGIEALETRLALAVTPSLVLDINAVPVGSDPASFALVGDIADQAQIHVRAYFDNTMFQVGCPVRDVHPARVGCDHQSFSCQL